MQFPDSIENKLVFVDTFAKVHSVMQQYVGKVIRVAYSGGSDSDTVLWLLRYLGYEVQAVFYDTGLEYAATWKHLDYMREQGFNIDVIKAKTPIPTVVKQFGMPFISKNVSLNLAQMQKHNFNFSLHGNFDCSVLYSMYPKMKTSINWWCNKNIMRTYNISGNRFLREFLMEYGLPFKVSSMCCTKTKKQVAMEYTKKYGCDLLLLGIRRAEGGIRNIAYKNCVVQSKNYPYTMFFPLFWWKKAEKEMFDTEMGIVHSEAYTKYGLQRTGCVGCPFNRKVSTEFPVVAKYEPNLVRAANNLFGQSYEWTVKYREYVKEMEK